MRDALCNEYPSRLFFPEAGAKFDQAKAICAQCLVPQECLAYAFSTPETLAPGVWGGTTPRERRAGERERIDAA